MAIPNEVIIECFRNRSGSGRGRLLHNATYYLIRMILSERDFDRLEDLAIFCAKPDNLRPWLPSQRDRIIFSGFLRECLDDVLAANLVH